MDSQTFEIKKWLRKHQIPRTPENIETIVDFIHSKDLDEPLSLLADRNILDYITSRTRRAVERRHERRYDIEGY